MLWAREGKKGAESLSDFKLLKNILLKQNQSTDFFPQLCISWRITDFRSRGVVSSPPSGEPGQRAQRRASVSCLCLQQMKGTSGRLQRRQAENPVWNPKVLEHIFLALFKSVRIDSVTDLGS